MSSAGTTLCGNVWLGSFGKRSLSQNHRFCMKFACASSSIATTWNGPASSNEPLPKFKWRGHGNIAAKLGQDTLGEQRVLHQVRDDRQHLDLDTQSLLDGFYLVKQQLQSTHG